MPTSQRIYSYYQRLRSTSRNRCELVQRDGSFFNNAVFIVSKTFKITMDEVRDAIYSEYAKAHNITVDDARRKFDHDKAAREADHRGRMISGALHCKRVGREEQFSTYPQYAQDTVLKMIEDGLLPDPVSCR